MKTTSLLSLSIALTLTTIFASVGCSQPTLQELEDDDDRGSDSSSTTKKKTTTDETAPSKDDPSGETPGSATPAPPADPGADPGAPPAGDAEACFAQCISGNAQAKQIDDQWLACVDQCQDQQCEDKCDQQADQACQANTQACDLLEQCGNQCFGGEGGDGAQP